MTTILALDTTTTNCSAAILHNGEIIQELSTTPRVHNEKILHMVHNLLQQSQLTLQQLDYIALSIGPGSFTGVRLGVSIAQGLAMGLNIKVIPISSLHAVACNAAACNAAACNAAQMIDKGQIVVAFDARMQQVYWSSYELAGGVLKRKTPDALANPAELAIAESFYATGDGFTEYKSIFKPNLSYQYIALEPNSNPEAKYVAMLAAEMTDSAIEVLELEPVYLRNNVAQKS